MHYYIFEGAKDTEKVKRGYLNEEYHLFHIKDKKDIEVGYHYHEFDKVIVFLSGKVTYIIEGKSYFLKPWDILLVGHDQIHSTMIDGSAVYDRIVIYLSPEFLKKEKVSECFERADVRNFSLIRAENEVRLNIMKRVTEAEEAHDSSAFGAAVMERTSVLQLLVELNRAFAPEKAEKSAFKSDPVIERIIHHIKENLEKDLSVDNICKTFFVSRSWLMHTFKNETGYTLHGFVSQKRLMYAAELIKEGSPVNDAALKCGFSDYSAFLKAFKKVFGALPKSFAK